MRSRVQVSLPLPENQGVTTGRSSFFFGLAHNLHTGTAISTPPRISRDRGLSHPEADPAHTHPRASAQPYPRKHPGKPDLTLPVPARHALLPAPARYAPAPARASRPTQSAPLNPPYLRCPVSSSRNKDTDH